MKRAIVGLLVGCLLFAAGCKKEATSDGKTEPAIKKLLARTDVVLIRHFYAKTGLSEDRDLKYPDIYPGYVSLTPMWIYEPEKQKNGVKGASITVIESWLPSSSGGTSKPESSNAFLDLDELKDLSNALGYFNRSDSPWRSASSKDDIEVLFRSKDEFEVAAGKTDEAKETLVFSIRNTDMQIPSSKLPEFKQELDDAIQMLESKGK